MGLRARLAIALTLLFGLLFAFGMGLIAVLEYFGIISGIYVFIVSLVFAIFVVFLQWALSPFIIMWLYKIDWTEPEALGQKVASYIYDVCAREKINVPKVGIINDANPNAFTFGWTKNHARIAVTKGIMQYCDEEERIAVIAHEMGHIVHDDFVFMTVISAIPLIFYIILRSSLYALRIAGRSRRGGQAAIVFLVTAAISFIVYVLSQFIALLVSRYREYYADEFSAESTGRPNKLASALLKIAYGMATEGLGERSDKEHTRHTTSLGIFNADSARALAAMGADAYGDYSLDTIEKAMAWDMWNPWATLLELQSTHPLPAKRLNKLGQIAEKMGQEPLISFKLKKPECYWDDFLKDILAKYGGAIIATLLFIFIPWYILTHNYSQSRFSMGLLLSITLSMFVIGGWGLAYLITYAYPFRFRDMEVINLISYPKASPIRGIPVRLKGRIIGRGVPGLFFSEDMKIDDGTGLLLIDYHQISKFVDILVGIFATEKNIGKEVIVEGWYRRRIVPYLELYRMTLPGDEVKRIYTSYFYIITAAVVMVLGLVLSFPILQAML